jgi:hypothetical protein
MLALAGAAPAQPPAKELPLVFREDFEKGADQWEPTDPKAWKVVERDGTKVFSQFVKASAYKPPHRSPFHIALRKNATVGDFILEAKVLSTIKDYGHRDACLFFGYQDAAHFYYVHLGKKTDDHANQIFIVNGADRKKISTRTTPGTNWTDNWHRVKIVRTAGDGNIEVYFDDMKTPVMTATDKTFTWGRVGIGSFDDTADWDDIVLRGTIIDKK